MSKERSLILFFYDNIIEQIHDISDLQDQLEESAFDKLSGIDTHVDFPNINMMKLRARFNIHRDYRIVHIKVPGDLDDDMIYDMFYENPEFQNLILQKGARLY